MHCTTLSNTLHYCQGYVASLAPSASGSGCPVSRELTSCAQQGYMSEPLSPSFGPASGGTLITVSLSATTHHHAAMPSATCLFNNVASPAELISASAATCLTPRAALGPASFQLIVDGEELYSGGEQYNFLFVEPGAVHYATPSVAITSGGGLVTVSGTFFSAAGNSGTCHFGAASVPAVVMSSSSLRCATPAARKEGRVALRVALNGADFASGEAPFAFAAPLRIHTLSPPATSPGGSIIISAEGLRPGQALTLNPKP